MKKFKTFLALLLVAALFVTLFAACSNTNTPNTAPGSSDSGSAGKDTGSSDTGSSDTGSSDTGSSDTGSSDTGSSDTGSSDTVDDPGDAVIEEDDLVTIEYIFYDFSSAGGDHGERIEAALNEITEKELGIHVNMYFITPGEWAAKAGMMVASGETVDLMVMCPPMLSLANMYNSNQVMDITELLPEYAPETYELVKNYLGNYTIEGKLVGIPALRNYCTNKYLLMDKEILTELGLLEKAQNMTSWSEYEEIMAAVTDKYQGEGFWANTNGIADLVDGINGMNFADGVNTAVSDSCRVAFVDNDGNVTLKQDMESFKASRQLVADWYAKGYIYPDAILATVIQDDLWKQGVVFSGPQGAEFGVEVAKSASFGREVIACMVRPGVISSAAWGQVVPITAEEPEAALRFLNACYTSPDIVTLLYRGIEGEDFEIVDNQVSYVDGSHYQQTACFFGCEFISYPLLGNGADFYEKVREINETAEVSPFMGFNINTVDLSNYISQISAVVDQYKITINCGGYTEALGQEYVDKLKTAEVDAYLAEIQKQVDAFLAAK